MQVARKFVALVVAATLCVLMVAEPLSAKAQPQSQNVEVTSAQVRYLHARGSRIEVTLADGTRLLGRIISVGDDSFTIREDKTNREVAWQYAQVISVKKKGLSAPFPLGFLCRQDPS